MKKVYFFDFDGTLTKRDTMFLFLKFYNAKRFFISFIKYSPLFLLVKLKLADAEKIKAAFIFTVLKNASKSEIERTATEFFNRYYPSIIREKALKFINDIDRDSTECYIVTASLDLWVKPFAEEFRMVLISTDAEYADGLLTGKFAGKNCNGTEKAYRIREILQQNKFKKSVAFGDSGGDRPMMELVDEAHFKYFH